jgi:small subunit ribosomal protein S1
MASISANLQDNTESTEFAALLGETLETSNLTGTVTRGEIIDFDDDFAIIDVGLKSEGRVPIREFASPGENPELRIGDEVDVYVERYEDRDGYTQLSRDKARREEVWGQLEQAYEKSERATGTIFGRVKGGFTVDLGGAVAFLPGSQVDIRPIRDVTPIMNTPQPFHILKMDRSRGNIVVSRRSVLEESREETRSELLDNLKEGQQLQGVVKNITDYGAFIDLGGVDGLLHVTDISWKRVNHPGEMLSVGDTVDVQIIRYNEDNQRISLGMKQLEADPWEGVDAKYPVGGIYTGLVTNITDYGAFVELEPGIEGLVHVSEMSWTRKNIHPSRLVSTSQEVDVMILDIDHDKRRISLGMKQTAENPWEQFANNYKAGDIIDGTVSNVTEFGLFVALPGDIDGMVHLSDISWEDDSEAALQAYNKGDEVQVKVLDIDSEKERVALGVKQLSDDPFKQALEGVNKGDVVTCTVTEVGDKDIKVDVRDGVTGVIKKADLSRERTEQRPDRFAVDEKIDAKVISIDKKNRKVALSIKQHEIDEDKAAVAAYGSTESGASLGDILGAALQENEGEQTTQGSESGESDAPAGQEQDAGTAEKAETAETESSAKSSSSKSASGSKSGSASKTTSSKSSAAKSTSSKASGSKSSSSKSSSTKSTTSKSTSGSSKAKSSTSNKTSGSKSSNTSKSQSAASQEDES